MKRLYLSLNGWSIFLVEGFVVFVQSCFTMPANQKDENYHFYFYIIIL